MEPTTLLIIFAIFLVAVLYSSVGHGGASGYLAVMAVFAVAPEVTRPTALTLNLFVASIATIHYYRAGHFSWRLFVPFAAASVPMAYIGGTIHLPTDVYKVVLGIVLLLAAARLAWHFEGAEDAKEPPVWLALMIGAVLGLVSGLVGVGGGIFLTPLLLLLHWARAKTAAAVSAMFILVNSAAGLFGNYPNALSLPGNVWYWVGAAVAGGFVGSYMGARRLDSLLLRRALAVVLVVAGAKLLFV
ncbi:MAG TPA: sulfite exporter TauE/SafE family protein [Pyrinomonadaceae bacterium]|nr:sulfite exporter TauE/SafE family protein [Pyrinomonadaceae bacterium]HMP65556.1 sulfite exporter TauE/SafE family protein [Pyrinomonadaceae bacterium]